ncbi:protein tramtrack, beta isoform isoform X6 [Ixodes scapularis]|uniref:protein tramtrack, beta isoform isoform X6 n=1 Tax=Ixodes scapularis TaxID=6945 RepID=UPI001C38D60F|nr:protein tramtrack, beta isoform isoform X6 [Ixodes scapularis]
MGSQQFCLKWNNHQSNMLVVFEQLLSNEALVDVTLACEGHSLKAHKMVLSACSPFFQALFVENPCKHPIVILKDMRYMDLKAIVEFMYKGEVNVSQDQLSALLKTAETLKVKGLAEVTGDNRHGLVSVDGADARTISTARPESPPMSKRKRGRPRRRSPSDSNKSDSEDQGAPPATRIKAPESPEIIEDGSMSSDRVTAAAVAAESPAARTSSAAVLTAVSSSASTVALSNKVVGGLPASALTANSMSSQHTQDSVGDDTGVDGDDADFEVEPSNLMEQSMTTENVPVFADVASSSQAAALASESQQSHHTGSTSDNSALVPVPASLPSDISISSQLDIKPSPSSLIPPFDEQAISPVVPPQPAGSADGSSSAMMMAFTDMSGVPAIAGPSNYHPDKQQSTPSHDVAAPRRRGRPPLLGKRGQPVDLECPICHKTFSNKSNYDGHLTMHTPQRKRYRCDICNKSFLWRNNVYAHKRKIHNVPSSRGNKAAAARNQDTLTALATSSSEPHWTSVMQQSMLAPTGFSASPSLLLLQAASAAWSDSREAHDK